MSDDKENSDDLSKLVSDSNATMSLDTFGGTETAPGHIPSQQEDSRNNVIAAAAEVSQKVQENRDLIKKGKKAKKGKDIDALKKEIETDVHIIPIEELVERLKTNIETGLTEEYAAPIAREKPNSLTPPKGTPTWVKFCKTMFSGFALLLWAGGILCFVAYAIESTRTRGPLDEGPSIDNLILGLVLVGVVIITGLFTFYQESNADKVLKGFNNMQPEKTRVKRDGKWKDLIASELVVGDIVNVSFGNKLPADIRIISQSGFKVDHSALTGEPDALSRGIECTHDNPMETKNVAFFSTAAVEGTCEGIVTCTGDDTYMGTIAALVNSTKRQETPINKEIGHFIHLITAIAVTLGVVFFLLVLFVKKLFWLDCVLFLIAIIVANVPEGLLATVTVSLTLTARRMAEKNVVVKSLESVETLGSTSCICSDKTGTLTQNRMTVNHLWYDSHIWGVDLAASEGCYQKDNECFKMMLDIGTHCSRAVFDEEDRDNVPIQEWKANGDASELAIMKFCQSVRDVDEARAAHPKVAEIPFNSSNKYAVTICFDKETNQHVLYMKGAPERVLDRCNRIFDNGQEVELDDERRANYDKSYLELGGRGERVLGFCYMKLDTDKFPPGFKFDVEEVNFPLEDLIFSGLYALIDPPRPAVPNAVLDCQSAGIRVIMVTGDHPITARAIAKQVHIITEKCIDEIAAERGCEESEIDPDDVHAIVVPGHVLKEMDDDALKDVIRNHSQIVFARTSPQQKLVIVEAVQQLNNVVAVTGDGVNDSPALRQADIGVAMGIAGTEVSKSAADMILMDDDFSSIVKGVEEGRLIFDNLKKSIAYTLTSNIPEITPFLFNVLAGLPLPLTTIMILCIDLGTDMYPAISLAYEGAESDIMRRRPRDAKKDKLVTAKLLQMTYLQIGVIQAMAGFFAYFVVLGDYGFRPSLLFGSDSAFSDRANEAYLDSYGQQWNYDSRNDILAASNTAFLVAIVIVQWADLIICKTRMLSVVHQGMRNMNLNFSLVFETVLIIMIVYIPGMDIAFNTRPLIFAHWLPAVPFSCLILLFDEVRKFFIRLYPGGWVEREFYY